MPQKHLLEALSELRSEVERLDDLDEAEQAKLHRVIDRLQRRLDDGEDEEAGLPEQLSDSIAHFEAKHPHLTAALNNIMSLLSSAGI